MKVSKFDNNLININFIACFMFFIPLAVEGRIDWNFSNFPNSVSYNGGVVVSEDIRNILLQDVASSQRSTYIQVRAKNDTGRYLIFSKIGEIINCPNTVTTLNYDTQESLNMLAQYSSVMLMNASPLLKDTGPGLVANEETYPFGITAMVTMCSPIDDPTKRVVVNYKNENGEIVVPPPEITPNSACNLNSQNLNLNYSSSNLNVDGLTQSSNLNISCTTGDAQNYQLKLTGTNVTNGLLNFNNGVSAQIYLNGDPVQANGAGIQLNSLTSSTIPISATLKGNSLSSGPSYASGVLVLEAQ